MGDRVSCDWRLRREVEQHSGPLAPASLAPSQIGMEESEMKTTKMLASAGWLLVGLTLVACADEGSSGSTVEGGGQDAAATEPGDGAQGTDDATPTDPCATSVCAEATCDGVPEAACCADETSCAIAIAGDYVDGFGGSHVVTSETWTMGESVFHLTLVDNDAGVAVAHNDASNEWSPSLWSRFEWMTTGEGQLYFCQSAFDAATEDAAWAMEAADASDPGSAGCSGFAWSDLSAP